MFSSHMSCLPAGVERLDFPDGITQSANLRDCGHTADDVQNGRDLCRTDERPGLQPSYLKICKS